MGLPILSPGKTDWGKKTDRYTGIKFSMQNDFKHTLVLTLD